MKRKVNIAPFVDGAAFKKFKDNKAISITDNSGVILSRNLEFITQEIFMQQLAMSTFLQTGIIVDTSGGYADFITKRKASIIADLDVSGSDRGANKRKISIAGEKDSIKVYGDESFSEWTESDIKKAEMENRNIVSEFTSAHATVYGRLIDKAGYVGIVGNNGLLNYGFASSTAAKSIDSMTAAEMYAEFSGLITAQRTGANHINAYLANTIVTSPHVLDVLNTTVYSTTGDNPASVMKALNANFPGIKFIGTHEADDGTSSKAVAFSNDKEAMVFRVPVPLQLSPITQKGFEYYVGSSYRLAGLDVAELSAGRTLLGL